MLRDVVAAYPNLKPVASTLRTAPTAARNAWGAIALNEDNIAHVPQRDIDTSTASAAETASPPASSTACSPENPSNGPSDAELPTEH